MRNWLFRRASGAFDGDRNGESSNLLAAVIASASASNPFTATLVPEGSGVRLALDRDRDGYYDQTEIDTGYDPADPASHPGRIVSASLVNNGFLISWESVAGLKYSIVSSTNLAPGNAVWSSRAVSLLASTNITHYTDAPPAGAEIRFYRVRNDP
jgi:hypothetical protein